MYIKRVQPGFHRNVLNKSNISEWYMFLNEESAWTDILQLKGYITWKLQFLLQNCKLAKKVGVDLLLFSDLLDRVFSKKNPKTTFYVDFQHEIRIFRQNDTFFYRFLPVSTDEKTRQLRPTLNSSIPNRFSRSDNGFAAIDEANRSV